MNEKELAILKHQDTAASQTTYDVRIANRLLMRDYAGALNISGSFYTRWPDHRGSIPKDTTLEELKEQGDKRRYYDGI